MRPPGLAWLTSFCDSIGTAMGQTIVSDVKNSVNPLVYTTSVSWRDPVKMDSAVQVWNLFQKWAAANRCTPSGRVTFQQFEKLGATLVLGLSVEVHLRERLGHPQDRHP